MKDINSYFAEKCSVRLCPSGRCYFTKIESNPSGEAYWEHEWSIQDPRCREIIREKFEIDTYLPAFDDDKWRCESMLKTSSRQRPYGSGKTIAEAEIACLDAIYEAEKAS